jgi:small subunit ribosomal protein S2
MGPYIFGTRNNIHIIDLAQTVPALYRRPAGRERHRRPGRRVLFVGTKRQAADRSRTRPSARRSTT